MYNPFFVDFIKILCPAYSLPSRQQLSADMLNSEISHIQIKINGILKNETCLTLGLDDWTSPIAVQDADTLNNDIKKIISNWHFYVDLEELVSIIEPIKKALKCFEFKSTTLADCEGMKTSTFRKVIEYGI
ncbi:unnamed protein product [Rhizophagus irregularis]|nr:unnamed protein product [Rhizophagus irregularis]